MNRIRESFLSLDLFSPTFQNIFLALLRGGGDCSRRPLVDSPLGMGRMGEHVDK